MRESQVEIILKLIPIYNTPGDWSAVMHYPYIYSTLGEWIGWITPEREVFDVHGVYVGILTEEPRILRKRTNDKPLPRRSPPVRPERIRPPAHVPLPPMMAELPFGTIDVLDEEPERLHTVDGGELRDDLD
jgi:hypothetical protein